MEEKKVYCLRCGKELKDKDSKKLGYGPNCIKKINPKSKSIFEFGKQKEINDSVETINESVKKFSNTSIKSMNKSAILKLKESIDKQFDKILENMKNN